MTKTVKAKHGWDFFYYGNLSRQGERAWYNDAELYKPRYTQTYFGIRNRLGILVETYSYATFEDRIKADYWFLEETLNFAVKQSARSPEGDVRGGRGIDCRQAAVGAREARERGGAGPGGPRGHRGRAEPVRPDRPMLRRVNGSEKVEVMPHYALVEPTETSLAPRAYVLPNVPAPPPAAPAPPSAAAPPSQPAAAPRQAGPPPGMGGGFGRGGASARPWASVLDRLEGHGVKYFRTSQEMTVKGERFRIESNTAETQEYQDPQDAHGHRQMGAVRA